MGRLSFETIFSSFSYLQPPFISEIQLFRAVVWSELCVKKSSRWQRIRADAAVLGCSLAPDAALSRQTKRKLFWMFQGPPASAAERWPNMRSFWLRHNPRGPKRSFFFSLCSCCSDDSDRLGPAVFTSIALFNQTLGATWPRTWKWNNIYFHVLSTSIVHRVNRVTQKTSGLR